jgi:ABC-type lipoprotein release transport system permease subunit
MMILLGALMWGMVQSMLETSLANLTGHLQVHHPDFLNDPAVENRIENPMTLEPVLQEVLPHGSIVVKRARLQVAANNARHSGGLILVGSDITQAQKVTFLKGAILEGEIPPPDSPNGILVGKELLEDFETAIGNKLILMAQDTNGEIASMAFRIVGTFETFLESNETGYAFAPLPVVQKFLSMGEGISEISIYLPDIEQTEVYLELLQQRLDPDVHEVTPWQEHIPMVTAYIQIWDYFAYMWGLVVFMAMGFGLVNTLLMAVYERIREFGLVRALGTRPGRIVIGVLLESSLLLIVGLVIGNIAAFMAIGWLGIQGIDLAAFSGTVEMFKLSRMVYPVINLRDLVIYNGLVFSLGILVSLYPAIKAARFTPVEAMTHFK